MLKKRNKHGRLADGVGRKRFMRFSVMWFLCPVGYTGSEGVFACVFRLMGLALSREKTNDNQDVL